MAAGVGVQQRQQHQTGAESHPLSGRQWVEGQEHILSALEAERVREQERSQWSPKDQQTVLQQQPARRTQEQDEGY
jgi:hypothetical protein